MQLVVVVLALLVVGGVAIPKQIAVEVCEHETAHIDCADGIINILSAAYGRSNDVTCASEGFLGDVNCLATNSVGVVQASCEGQTSCSIDAENAVFGDPCFGTFKYLHVEYVCVPTPIIEPEHGVLFAQACEGSVAELSCPNGVVTILDAVYGRSDATTCASEFGAVDNVACVAPTSLAVVNNLCADQPWCTVSATNDVFGDPCVGTYKYLSIAYRCVPDPHPYRSLVIACENDVVNIDCVDDEILILSAAYGRSDAETCALPDLVGETNCAAENTFAIVDSTCSGHSYCSVGAQNEVFGDPCVGTYKYLRVEYSCRPRQPNVVEVCEHESATLTCDTGVIRVTNAAYGRSDPFACAPDNLIDVPVCLAVNSYVVLSSTCSGLSSCTIDASNDVFGDPCEGVFKYLHVEYLCVPESTPEPLAVEVCENEVAEIDCNGAVIVVSSAAYGRSNAATCAADDFFGDVNCLAATSFDVVSSLCSGQTLCTIDASNEVFGDPCVGTFKYLRVEYYCVSVDFVPPNNGGVHRVPSMPVFGFALVFGVPSVAVALLLRFRRRRLRTMPPTAVPSMVVPIDMDSPKVVVVSYV
eukprot:c19233_g1_i2.p1 GENE.c19233_g1_i2~~c19233_g1_i2.p1  ORF type:complete len:585 (+),score=127.87 c19233_g1_i2:33-1787(+)